MALDRIFGQLFEIARSLSGESQPPPRPSAPPPAPSVPQAAEVRAEVRAEAPATAVAVSDAGAGAGASAAPADEATLVDEPIVSAGMARLLAAQGHTRRALAMYESLAVRKPDDAAIARELDALRKQTQSHAPVAEEDDDGLAGEDEIVAIRASESDVLLSWQVGDARIARGKRLLPAAERMAVRIVLFHRGEGALIRREERERFVERVGEWLVADVPRDAWMTASVGLRHDERFVSLTHSAATRAP